ncbi:MAG: hypothetical protein WA117_19535, partial [Verrucomicrobiia bacterium]
MNIIPLIGITNTLSGVTVPAGDSQNVWLVYVPKGDQKVTQKKPDGTPYMLRVNPTPLSAKRMEASRRSIERKGGNQLFTDYN